MGLLSNILGKVAANVLSQVKENIMPTTGAKPAAATPRTTPVQPDPDDVPQRSAAEWKAYFREILALECGAYAVREEVPVTDLVGHAEDEFQLYSTRPRQAYKAEWGQPYSFVLYQAGAPKGVVMLGSGHSHDSNVKYLIARMYAKKLGIPYINFYTQMPNERSYVISRLRKFLG